METETSVQTAPAKKMPCACTLVLGALVIVFAWWDIGWAKIALTILGALVFLKGLANACCCTGTACSTAPKK